MSLLAPLLFVPAGAALGCSLVRSRRMMAALGVLAFGLTLAGASRCSAGSRRAAQ